MREKTLHLVHGVGRQRPADDTRPFNPRVFEQAIHGLQRITLDLARVDDDAYMHDDNYQPGHEQTTDDEGTPMLVIQEDTLLHDIHTILQRGWDASVLLDTTWDNSYAIRTSVDCGGGIIVYASIFVQDGMLRHFNVGHTSLLDDDDPVEVRDLNTHSSSRVLTHVNRFFERSVQQAYAQTIPSAATAFDFLATKEDIPPSGGRGATRRNRRESLNQSEWAEIRDKTPQTVSDNVRDAREQLLDLDARAPFKTRNPALEELHPDADDSGDIRLV